MTGGLFAPDVEACIQELQVDFNSKPLGRLELQSFMDRDHTYESDRQFAKFLSLGI